MVEHKIELLSVRVQHPLCLNPQVLYDVFFKSSSSNDIGTMCANINVINNCNAKTPNVLDNFNQCKDFINLETDDS